MRLIQMLARRTRALFRRDDVEGELRDEIAQHIAVLTEQYVAQGMAPEAARAAALREFGPVSRIVDASRDARGVAWLENAWHDVRYGVRLMRRAPTFAAAVALTIALGVGATTAMFSVLYGVVLQPLPYRQPDRLVNLWSTAFKRGLPRAYVGMANVYDWRARNHTFEAIAALRAVANFNLTGQGEPERLNGSRVSANLFPVLGATPLHGRTFSEDEDEIGHDKVAILTYGLWMRRFAGDPAVVGRSILLNGDPHTVVGVMRADFAFPSREYQIYTPLTFDPQELVTRMNYSYLSVARLRPGVSVEQAQADMDVVSTQLAREYPLQNDGIGTIVAPMLADTTATVRTPLLLLFAAVTAMLLIGCANLTNLLVARAFVRQRELAVRVALGAARWRLVMQSIAELVPMLAVGGVLGLAGAAWVVRALVPMLPSDVPRVENVSLDLPVLAYTAATLAAIALLVGIWPALEASRGGRRVTVADLSRGNTGSLVRSRLRDILVVVQIAASLWLAVGAVLLTRSFTELRQVDPGFNPDRVYSLHLAIPRGKYPDDHDVAAFANRMLDRVRAVPDVVSIALVNRLPLAGGAQTGPIEIDGTDAALGPGNVDFRSITPEYFATMSIPVLEGRAVAESDRSDGPLVAVIDERLAKTVLRGLNPIGRRMRIAVPDAPWMTIVGVAGHIRHDGLDEDTRPQVYFPYSQRTQDRMALVVRTRSDPSALGPALAAAIRAVDPDQPVYDARTLAEVVARSVRPQFLQTMLLAAIAVIALVLASIGVYGVIAYAVGQRYREFGIRLALGARRREIVGLVLRRGAALSALGTAIGLAAAAITARALSGQLYGIAELDPFSFVAATLILAVVAFAACAIPARRAANVDPALSLRAE